MKRRRRIQSSGSDKYPAVYITWIDPSDTQGNNAWIEVGELKKIDLREFVVHTLGFLVEETEEYVRISRDRYENQFACPILVVPKVNIITMKKIKYETPNLKKIQARLRSH